MIRPVLTELTLFFVPFVLYALFVLVPVAITIVLSFTYYDISFGADWVWFENYQRFFGESRSITIFWNTLRFAFFAVTGNVLVGLLLAITRRNPFLRRETPGLRQRLFGKEAQA